MHISLFSFRSSNAYRTVVTVLGSGNSKINEKCHLSLRTAPSGVEGTAHARAHVVELSGVEQECRPRLNPHNAKREQKKSSVY